ncbi:MAG: UDP-N-acetylglucosamine--N-acetylmuramyl-(pentapeptide) pyrophosphoryl-undecaprenol N-acetylglucosamine transferase [Phycisphaerales bacterium]|jgi:UDP-N-acetylglucosamine--N-acetylmuramyl-(pentapeptide) pyrophosphoryl-undecaprenol N-acetylglucosamine transferase
MSGTNQTSLGVIFAGGGTGGHLFPALAVAEELGSGPPSVRTHFLCSDRPLDARILTAAGVAFTPLAARPVVTKPMPLLKFAASWGPSVRATRAAIRELRAQVDRVHMVTMGGFVAPPAVQAARAEKVPVLMVNLDAVPGLANRFIAKRVSEIVSAVRVEGRGWETVPPVVRQELRSPREPGPCRESFGLDPKLNTLLITGGSQGARSVGQFVVGLAEQNPGSFEGWQVIHQSGSHGEDNDGYIKRWADLGVRAHVEPFLTDMPSAWWGADLHVGRCGAGTVAESWATRTPSVFMPYPWHKDLHQKHNAQPLAGAGAAALIEDRIEAEKNLAQHGALLVGLLTDPGERGAMARALEALGEPDGALRIAQRVRGDRSSA